MGLADAVAELRRRWAELPALLAPDPARTVRDLADGLVTEGDAERRQLLALRMLRVLDSALSPAHPIRLALLDGEDFRSPATAERLDDELAALRLVAADIEAAFEPDPAGILAAAQADLLAAASMTAGELRAVGGDPDHPDLLRLPSAAGDRLPRFQLDSVHEPYEVVLAVNRILQAEADPWGAASWWLRANGWLDAVPAELVGTRSSDRLTAAALAEWEDD